jgi:hypothetical protein
MRPKIPIYHGRTGVGDALASQNGITIGRSKVYSRLTLRTRNERHRGEHAKGEGDREACRPSGQTCGCNGTLGCSGYPLLEHVPPSF